MKNIITKIDNFLNENYKVGDKLISRRNFDVFKGGEEYEVSSTENLFGEVRYFLKDKKNKVVNKGFSLKKVELDIHFVEK